MEVRLLAVKARGQVGAKSKKAEKAIKKISGP